MATVRKRTWTRKSDDKRCVAWLADYLDQHGKRHAKTFESQREAKAWLVATQGEVSRGVHTPENSSITLAEAAESYLAHCLAEGLEPSSLRRYRDLVRHILEGADAIGSIKLAQLTTPFLEAWRDRLVERLSRRLAGNVLARLKAILTDAMRRGAVAQNVALPVTVKGRKRDQRRIEIGVDVPEKTAVQCLLAACDGDFADYRPLLVTAILTGMRASELRGLEWSAIDFQRKLITVRQRARWAIQNRTPDSARSRCHPTSSTPSESGR